MSSSFIFIIHFSSVNCETFFKALDICLDSNIAKCSKQVKQQMLTRGPYCVKPELDNGSVIEFTDLRADGNTPLLFELILLVALS